MSATLVVGRCLLVGSNVTPCRIASEQGNRLRSQGRNGPGLDVAGSRAGLDPEFEALLSEADAIQRELERAAAGPSLQ